jgi:DNA-binding CsgD family transcriptional regulator
VNASGAALDHPIWQAITEDPTAPVQLSQLMSRRQWEAHPLYAEFFRYDGVADHMTIDLPGAAGVSDMIGVMRSSRGFGELEEQVFRIITPHLRQALSNCRLYQKPATQLPMVDPDRELKQHCNQWVVDDWKSFCEIVGRRRDFWHKQTGLSVQAFDASAIRCWAELQCHQLSNGTFAGRLTPLRFVGPTATLELKLLRNWDGRGYCLLEMLAYAAGDDPLRVLTPRQKELLRWIGEGKADREIAIILGLSLHTVKSYLKALYRVLGVRNRTEAGRFTVDQKST